ncbi:apicoplast ribosomal protein S15, putative [Hepatocystis sp. ex Piliocolobus tephrosceles]|nr:apicoplast ribosomal protein S15, putative [Hepatocystis sp. ex Piliocolobus tephrosceles]
MKKITSCLTFLSLCILYLLHKVQHSNGFNLNTRTKNYSECFRVEKFYLLKYQKTKKLKQISHNNENIIKHLPNVYNQQTNVNTTEKNINNSNIKTKADKQQLEINEILKTSEQVTMERSFSFKKEDITIKPKLLQELITQKYRKMFQRHDTDCGSSEMQIIILTFKIFFLTDHMKKNKKDFACLRCLFKCVSKRRKLLVYLGSKDREKFDQICDFFKIKKPLLKKTPEYYSKDLKYIHFNNTKRYKNNLEKKKKDKLKNKKTQTDKILFGSVN